jgi:hypothetical protein
MRPYVQKPLIVLSLVALFALSAGAAGAQDVSGSGEAVVRPPEDSARPFKAIPLATVALGTSCSLAAPLAGPGQSSPSPFKNASTGLSLSGSFTFSTGGTGARMTITHVINSRSSGTSGSLRLALWATTSVPVFGNTIPNYTMATYDLNPLTAGFEYNNVDSGVVPFTAPPAGCYYVTLALLELQSGTYFYQDLDTATAGGKPDGTGHSIFSYGGATCGTCVRDANTACLLSGRFRVTATYKTSSATGEGTVMDFGGSRAESDESVFLWFFDPSNFEMGLKMLDACTLNNHFWVYIGGLTDQGWTVNIVDSTTGASRTYSNALGHLSSSVADTSALPCP